MRFFLSILFISIPICLVGLLSQITDTANVDSEIVREAGEFLDHWHRAAATADFDKYFAAISEDGVFVGTDAGEIWNKEEFTAYAKPHFDAGKTWSFRKIKRRITISEDGQFLWFNETLDTWMGVCRGSGILKITEGSSPAFEIKQYVLSLTIPNEKMSRVKDFLEE